MAAINWYNRAAQHSREGFVLQQGTALISMMAQLRSGTVGRGVWQDANVGLAENAHR